ncbi:MAG TPA: hypothetical protein VIL60_09175 [Rhodanobacter sp.]
MLTKDQAQAVSIALLRPARAKQSAHTARIARRQRALSKRKWLGGGALFGSAIGTAISGELPGHPFAPSVIGFITGAIVGGLFGKLRA